VLKALKAVKDSKVPKESLPQAHKEPLVQLVLRVHKGLLDQHKHVFHFHSVTSVLILLGKLVVLGVVLGVLLNTRHVQHLLRVVNFLAYRIVLVVALVTGETMHKLIVLLQRLISLVIVSSRRLLFVVQMLD